MPGAGLPEQGHDDPKPVLGVTRYRAGRSLAANDANVA